MDDQNTTPETNEETQGGEVQAVVYSTPTCHFCHQAKEFFDTNNVKYEDINVAEDPEARQAMIEMTGQMGVPVIKIGDDVMVGYDEEKIKELLKL